MLSIFFKWDGFLGHPVYRFNAKFVEINIKLEKENLRIKKKHLKNG